jgi:hypothetical protein
MNRYDFRPVDCTFDCFATEYSVSPPNIRRRWPFVIG